MSTAIKKEFLKAKKIVHPNSRKSIAITKRTKKILNRQKVKLGGLIKQNLIGKKMLWIQEHMEPNVCPYTPESTARLLETYIARNDEELEQINIKHSIGGRKNRQHASRQDVLRMTKEREQEEYNTCGIEIPDILNATQCDMLKKWNGELKYMTNFKFRRFGKKHLNDILHETIKQADKNNIQINASDNVGSSCKEIIIENTEKDTILNKPTILTEEKQTIECSMEAQ